MKKRFTRNVLILLVLVLLLTIPVSASSVALNFTIYGTQDYDEANDVLAIVNQERAAEGLSALRMDPTLTAYAMQRAAEIAVYYSHTRTDGTRCFTVMDGVFAYGYRAENIAMGYGSASAVMDGWMNSQGHHDNIMNSVYTSIGIGCFYQDDGTKCWVQLFSSVTTSDVYSQSGTKTVMDIPITLSSDYLQMYVTPSACDESFYAGTTKYVTVSLGNLGWSYASKVKLSGGYTLTSDDASIVKADNSQSALIGVNSGSTTAHVILSSTVDVEIDVTVLDKIKLTFGYDSSGNPVVYYDQTVGSDVALFFKEENDDLWTLNYLSTSGNSFTHYTAEPGAKYTYVMRVSTADGWVDISNTLTVTITDGTLDAPVVKASNILDTGKIQLTWAAVDGASKYEIYRSTSQNGTYTKLNTVTGTIYKNISVSAGDKYWYKVKAVSDDGSASEYSKAVSITVDLARPDVTATNVASTGKIKLTWPAVEGATKYVIYRSTTVSGTYSKLSEVTGTSYINASVSAGKKYYYKVRAFCDNAEATSAYSYPDGITVDLARPNVTASNILDSGKIKLTWPAVDGASKYEIYRSTSASGTYTKLNTVSFTSYTNVSVKAGEKYYYKVRAICDNADAASAFSVADGITVDLARPDVTISLSNGKPKLTWNAVEGATGYTIYRATSKNGTYTKLRTVTGTSYSNPSAASGTTYYYKVIAVCSNSDADSAYTIVSIKTQ